jgi:hypothetical protein
MDEHSRLTYSSILYVDYSTGLLPVASAYKRSPTVLGKNIRKLSMSANLKVMIDNVFLMSCQDLDEMHLVIRQIRPSLSVLPKLFKSGFLSCLPKLRSSRYGGPLLACTRTQAQLLYYVSDSLGPNPHGTLIRCALRI